MNDRELQNAFHEYDYIVLELGIQYWVLAQPKLGWATVTELTKKYVQFVESDDAEARAHFTCQALNDAAEAVRSSKPERLV